MNRFFMFVNKKGELTSNQIIALVLAIAGFIVVLIFLAIIYDSSKGQDSVEACRLSVLTRATTPHAAQAAVPLACTTGKICVSMSGNKTACPQFLGEDGVISVKLEGKTPEDNARLIEKTSAEAMYQCWSMMGKGQLDLFGTAGELFWGSGGDKKATCVICSRVAYSNDIKEDILSKINLQDYLENALVPGSSGLTYLQAFTDRSVNSFAGLQGANPDKPLNLDPKGDPVQLSGQTNGKQIAFVFSQIKSVPITTVLKNLGYAAVGSTFVISQVPGVSALGGRAAGAILTNPYGLAVTAVAAGAVVGGVSWNAYNGQRAAAGYCGAFTSSVKDLKDGCSLVQAVNYNVGDINALCPGSIQGNP